VTIDVFAILFNAIYVIAGLAFLSGLLITATTGSAKPVQTLLKAVTVIFTLLLIASYIVFRLVIFLAFQIIALVLIWEMCIVIGAVCGGAIYSLRHKQPVGRKLTQDELGEYLPVADFAALEGIEVERALARIKSSYYRGGQYEGAWYIHRSEQSQKA
jgi:hypothetical protein